MQSYFARIVIPVAIYLQRKRMHGLAPSDHSCSDVAGGLYSATYHHLLALAQSLLVSGHTAIIDATFL